MNTKMSSTYCSLGWVLGGECKRAGRNAGYEAGFD